MGLMSRVIGGAAVLCLASLTFADFDGPAPLAWRWAQPTSAAPYGSPIVDDANVYAAVGGRMYAIERQTGNHVWRYPAGEPIQANFRLGAVLSKDLLIAPADDKSIYAVDVKTGQLAWQYLGTDAVATTVVAAGNFVVFGTVKNEIRAINIADGKEAWSAPFKVGQGIHPVMSSSLNSVIFTTNDSTMVSLDVISQRKLWEAKFSRMSPNGSFAVSGDRIYVNSGNFLVCVRGSNGRPIWQTNVGQQLANGPAAGAQGVATMGRNGLLYTYDINGRPVFKKGIELGAPPAGSPIYVGKNVVVTTTNGGVNLVNPQTGDLIWTFTMPSLNPGATKPANPAGGGAGDPPIGGTGGTSTPGGAGGSTTQTENPDYVPSAGNPVVAGNTLFVLSRDGSIFAFDKELGVDLTPPEVKMLWPNAGDQIAGKSPMELIFRATDLGSGVNPDSLSITIGGENYIGTINRSGYISVKIVTGMANKPLQNGRKVIVVKVTDWVGNIATASFAVTIDNTLPALGSPKPATSTGTAGGPGGRGPVGSGG